MKPIALYDKSFIQSLNLKEAELFGLFFATNIIPTLIREIGADLTKEITQPTKEVSNSPYAKTLFLRKFISSFIEAILAATNNLYLMAK